MKHKSNQDDEIMKTVKISSLEQTNKILKDKIKLLRIQLEAQTQLQTATFSRSRTAFVSTSRQSLLNSRNFHSTGGLRQEDKTKIEPRRNYESIFRQLSVLETELENIKDQHRNRIVELEEQLEKSRNAVSPTKLKIELNENVELIKFKRLSKKQSAQILSLQSQLDLANSEIEQLQNNLTKLTNEKDEILQELSNEKCETVKLQSEISSSKDHHKLLEQQLEDLKAEKVSLKEHNENLLKLSLEKESMVSDGETKIRFLKQIKELEENLRKEIVAKSELSSKLADIELSNVKLSNELARNNAILSDIQAANSLQKNEIERLKVLRIQNQFDEAKKTRTPLAKINKSVMTSLEDNKIIPSTFENDHIRELILDKSSSLDTTMKLKLSELTAELAQYKELLRVQHGINNKYKKEIEELQRNMRKKEKSLSDMQSLQSVIHKHRDRLVSIEKHRINIISGDDLSEISVNDSLSLTDYTNAIDKILNDYLSIVESLPSKQENTPPMKTNVIKVADECVQVGNNEERDAALKLLEEFETEDLSSSLVSVPPDSSEKAGVVVFQLRIEKAHFDYFSEHLMKSSKNNPRIFLTWNFLDDTEHQAYTPTISVKKGVFDCCCQYEGPWSEFLYKYLKSRGICIEIHLVQGDISVKLAETTIDTRSCLEKANECLNFDSEFHNDNLKGRVTGSYILKCDPILLKTTNYFNLTE